MERLLFCYQAVPWSDRGKAISTLASPKYNRKFVQIWFCHLLSLAFSCLWYTPSGLNFFSPVNVTDQLPSIKKLVTLAIPKNLLFLMEQESTLQVHPLFMFFHWQIHKSISCFQIQKDGLLDFFYCMVWSKTYKWLPNCDWSNKIVFWSLGTAQILNVYSPCI